MGDDLETRVRERARGRCEYCQTREEVASAPFALDHIIARKHGGKDSMSNLALASFSCNSFKGPNVAGVDPQSGKIVRLFNPRRHKWSGHFRWDGAWLVGRTAIGRTTIAVLAINHPDAVTIREALAEEGLFSPESIS
jgi:hypothetical protein